MVLTQAYYWSLLFSGITRYFNSYAITATIGAFALSLQVTYLAVWMARKRHVRLYGLLPAIVTYAFLLITVEFATLYWTIGTAANFNVELSRWDAIYFALGTLTTAGTGAIAPISGLARVIVSGQMAVDFVFIAVAVTIAISRWSERPS